MNRGARLGLVAAALAVAVMAGARPGAAQDGLPRFTAPVVDQAGVVPDDTETRVNAALNDYQRRSGNQVAVAVVRTTGKRSLEDYTIDLARAWGVGERGRDNGVLLLIAYDDRRLRIEVGRGLEGELTDLESGDIIDERIRPLLRQGDVGGAVSQGTDAIRQALGDTEVGQLPPVPSQEEPAGDTGASWPFWLFMVPVFGGLALAGRRGRHRGGRGFGGPVFWGGAWGGSGFGGGGGSGWSGGGGFGGGGGGGFGGGGASGGW